LAFSLGPNFDSPNAVRYFQKKVWFFLIKAYKNIGYFQKKVWFFLIKAYKNVGFKNRINPTINGRTKRNEQSKRRKENKIFIPQ
jgi:hypothetical protein